MSSKIFNSLLEEKIDTLIQSFKNTSRTLFFDDNSKKLIHSGEFGMYREKIVREFLKFFIPQKLSIGNGFIISSNDEISTQCDIIIYDSSITPLIQSNELQTFYPIETVIGIGEIKSKLSKLELKDAINKLARIKNIKSNILHPNILDNQRLTPFDSKGNINDNIFTFIICEKLNFKLDNIENEIKEMYDDDINYWNKHNLILSLEDGILVYNLPQKDGNVIFYHPFLKNEHTNRFVKIDPKNTYHHLKLFTISLFDGISSATILYPEMVHYMQGFTAVTKLE